MNIFVQFAGNIFDILFPVINHVQKKNMQFEIYNVGSKTYIFKKQTHEGLYIVHVKSIFMVIN